MRKNMLAGCALAATATGLVIFGSALDLELQPVTLLGVAVGAVLALVGDHTPAGRLGGFAAGLLAAWAGYVFRAQFMPDTETGRAIFAGVVVLLCTLVVVGVRDRLPLWAVLLGAAAFAGAFEAAYTAEPPLVLANSLSSATALLMAVAGGYLVAGLVRPATRGAFEERPAADRHESAEHAMVAR